VTSTTQDMTSLNASFGELRGNWGWLLALGILFVILGTIGLGMSFALTMASMLFFGVLMLIGGGFQLGHAFKCKGWKCILWHIVTAVLYVIAGLMFINDPALASTIITLLIAGIIIGIGLFRVFIAFQMKGASGWWWLLLGGIVSIILGVLILAELPSSGMWVIGLFIAVDLIMHGWSYIFVALAARTAGKSTGHNEQPINA